MSDQATSVAPNSPPPLPQKKRRWRWWQTVLVIIFGGYFILKLISSYNPVSLDVRLFPDGSVSITNTGDGPIKLLDVLINDRRECREKSEPRELKIGEQAAIFSPCNIVRLSVQTSKGSATYSFNR